MGRQTDNETDIGTQRQIDKTNGRWIDKQTDGLKNIQTDRRVKTDGLRSRQTDRRVKIDIC